MSSIDAAVILTLAGCVLIVGGAVAGTPLVRAVGLAGIGPTPRLVAGGAGILCVVAGFLVPAQRDYCGDTGRLIRVEILNELNPGQLSETVAIKLDGRDLGAITVDKTSPTARLPATLSAACTHPYELGVTRRQKGKRPMMVTSRFKIRVARSGPLYVLTNTSDGSAGLATRLP